VNIIWSKSMDQSPSWKRIILAVESIWQRDSPPYQDLDVSHALQLAKQTAHCVGTVLNRTFRVLERFDKPCSYRLQNIDLGEDFGRYNIGLALSTVSGMNDDTCIQILCFWTSSIVQFLFKNTTFRRLDSVFVFRPNLIRFAWRRRQNPIFEKLRF
jgi:hypothetical protein